MDKRVGDVTFSCPNLFKSSKTPFENAFTLQIILKLFSSILYSRDFAHKLSLALIANGNTLLHTLDLSNNLIEDKGKNFLGIFCIELFFYISNINDQGAPHT